MRTYGAPALVLFATLGGCRLEDRIDEGFDDFLDTPSFDGNLELEVTIAEGLDRSKVRAGLFHSDAEIEILHGDGTSEMTTGNLDVRVSVEGKVALGTLATGLSPAADDTLLVNPLELYAIESGPFSIMLPPNPASYETTSYRLVIWYDGDDDGSLRIGPNATSEYARAPSRPFDHDDDEEFLLTMYLHNLSSATDEDGLPWEGEAIALRRDEYISHYLGQGQRTNWSASINDATQ